MQKALSPSSLVPPGFAVVSASTQEGAATIVMRSTSTTSRCPGCGQRAVGCTAVTADGFLTCR